MKTLKEAQRYHNQLHYRLTCEYCHEECIVDEDDFDNFFGIPDHKGSERAWKCPVCGHVTIESGKGMLYSLCDERGRFKAVTPQC